MTHLGTRIVGVAWLTLAAMHGPLLADEDVLPPELAAAERTYRTAGPESALPELERLLEEYSAQNHERLLSVTHTMLGDCHWRLGHPELARMHLDSAADLSRRLGDRRQEAKAVNLLGLLAWDRGDLAAAARHLDAAFATAVEVGDLRLQGAALNNLSLVQDELGNYAASLAQYERVLQIYAEAGFTRGEGDTLGNIGGVKLLLGNYGQAVQYYQRALQLSETLQSLPAQSQDHGNLGYAYAGLGDYALSRQHFETALDLARRSGMRLEEGYWLRGLATVQVRFGQLDQGLDNYRAALEIYRAARADALLLEALHDLGQLMLAVGDPVTAERSFQEAMELARTMGHARGVTLNLIALGKLQLRHRRLDEAEALYRQALDRAGESGEQGLRVSALLQLAGVQLERGVLDESRALAGEAGEIAQTIGALPQRAAAGLLLARVDEQDQRYAEALALLGELDPLVRELGDPDLAWQLEYARALALIAVDRKPEAVTALRAAIDHIESVRGRLREKRFRTGYLQDKYQVYIQLVQVLLELDLNLEALSSAERLRTLSFTEQSERLPAQSGTDPTLVGGYELRERIRQLQRELDAERAQPLSTQRQAAIESFSRELVLAEQQYQAYLDDRAVGADSRVPVGIGGTIGTLHLRLQPREALIEYVVGSEAVMLFVLRSDGLFATTVPVAQEDIRSGIHLLRDLIQQRDDTRWSRPAVKLARTLLDPALESGWLSDVEHLYLVPHGVLNYLPFAILPAGSGSDSVPLVERYTMTYLSTALALTNGRREPASRRSLLGVAPERSRLRFAPDETISVAKFFRPHARVLNGQAATESLFVRIAGEYQVLHLATHSYFNKFNPLLSGLELEADRHNDGLLEVHEILRLRLQSELVTLSACETGMGSGYFSEFPAGDDFVGMTRAFLQAGSQAVLATLWEVDDRSTADLMQEFYAHLQDAGQQHMARALTKAQRVLRSHPQFAHPYYWAPFVLVGTTGDEVTADS